mgnify:CR=1 FL=1
MLPGGGRKPRTATPFAWRLVFLGVAGLLLWSLYSTKSAYSTLSEQVPAQPPWYMFSSALASRPSLTGGSNRQGAACNEG